MAILTSDGATLRAFAERVMDAASENAEEVVPLVLAVVGGILCTVDPGTATLDEGMDRPVLWGGFGGRRMAFSFNPLTAMIELHQETLDGHPARRFGRRSLPMDILNFFGPDRAALRARNAL